MLRDAHTAAKGQGARRLSYRMVVSRLSRAVARNSIRAQASKPAPGSVLPALSTSSRSDHWQLAIMGDLHLAPEQMKLFEAARGHLRTAMLGAEQGREGARVVQLGDLGHSKHQSGSRKCFEFAKDYLEGFGLPYALVTGNHDLEGDEFETDEENLAAWSEVFQQPHYWAADLGRARLVGLSTVRYRSNENSHHEVFISDDQVAWLEQQLADHPDTPFLVLTHAPPMGCGLKVIQEVHVKNRCAWLNHSGRPRTFLDMVARHRNIKLWFSGHFHLSHNYLDSISTVGGTAFVQVGVIGECNRDGTRQSRMVRGGPDGYQLFTVDHDTGALRLDMAAAWDDAAAPVPVIPEDELLCDPDAGWLCSQLDCKMGDNSTGFATWYPVGSETILALQAGGLLIEYDPLPKYLRAFTVPHHQKAVPAHQRILHHAVHRLAVAPPLLPVAAPPPPHRTSTSTNANTNTTRTTTTTALPCADMHSAAPIGLVTRVPDGCTVELATSAGQPAVAADGSDVAELRIREADGTLREALPRNPAGAFYRIFQPNKWRLKRQQQQQQQQVAAPAMVAA